jgi:hypothetical protein
MDGSTGDGPRGGAPESARGAAGTGHGALGEGGESGIAVGSASGRPGVAGVDPRDLRRALEAGNLRRIVAFDAGTDGTSIAQRFDELRLGLGVAERLAGEVAAGGH